MKKIALLLNDDFSMWHFRGGLIRSLVRAGHDVTCIVPSGDYVEKVKSLGCSVICVPMNRFVSPVQDIALCYRLFHIFRQEAFDIVHTMTVKPNIFGTIAAKLAGVPKIVGLVSGLGFTFAETKSTRDRIVQFITKQLYKFALGFSDGVWFQNPDDLAEFSSLGLLKKEKGLVIRSGGISLSDYSQEDIEKKDLLKLREELNIPVDSKCIVMVAARMIWSKGVKELIEASEQLLSEYPDWKFVMLCPMDPSSPDAVPSEYLKANSRSNLVVVDTFRDDAKNFLALAEIVVLCSYYREGVPRTLLEAMALEKPLITTKSPGCREVVREGENGFLIPPKDSQALVAAIKALADDDVFRREMGKKSRKLAQEEFSEEKVCGRIQEELYGIQNPIPYQDKQSVVM